MLAAAVEGEERAFLNVVSASPAVGFYERSGWRHLGEVPFRDLALAVFLSP